ncbi:CDP-glycerol glycerophosphotransferase family protein [Streptomyces sp. KK5PA1]|uniref:CDP-glycerol glycerophosphotransferase family protein n=1 Tax=Actinacidiphila acididurans TaxID=2784346 RepID=A0ABS2TZU0_9ACTN|nr:CDP-glycerol glycerophosphotransferase family protein [Actinacidiphila acididurans]
MLAAYRPADPADPVDPVDPADPAAPAAPVGPGGEVGEWLHAVGSGSWPRFRVVTAGRAVRAGVGARARGPRRALRGRALRAWYRLRLRRPLDPRLVVYAAYWSRGVFCNPAAIARKAADLAPHLKAVWVVGSADRERLPPGTAHVVAGSARYWDVMARAGFLVNNAGFPGAVVKRPGQVYLQTHHGTPLKLMGTDLYDRPAAAAAMDFPRLLEHARQWDVSLVPNGHSAEVWERVYPGGYRTLPSGYPRNDVLWTAGAAEVRAARAALGLAPGTTAILYAPTHRDHRRRFTLPLDPVRLSRDLGPGHTVLVRAHYFYDRPDLADLHERGQVLDVSGHDSVEELCLAADALLTDYSSLMFDYAALDRPIVVHAPDWDAYRAARGVYFDLLSGKPGETPGVIARDQAEVAASFRTGAHRGPGAAALRAAFRERFCAYDDGLAAERVVRHVLLGEPGLLPHRPLYERSPAPTPEAAERAGTVSPA